jgi:hypothetical protein
MPRPADTLTGSRGRQGAGRADTAERRDPSHSRRLDAAPTHQAHHVSHQPHATRAKYSTKSATDLNPGTRPANLHLAGVRTRVFQLAALAEVTYPPGLPDPPNPYRLLGKWAYMLTFRGHSPPSPGDPPRRWASSGPRAAASNARESRARRGRRRDSPGPRPRGPNHPRNQRLAVNRHRLDHPRSCRPRRRSLRQGA